MQISPANDVPRAAAGSHAAAAGRARHIRDWEQLVLRISTDLISKDAVSLLEALPDALHRLGEFSGADRCYVFVYEPESGTMSNTHEWCSDGIGPQREYLQNIPASVWPYWMEQLERRGIVDWPQVDALPEAAAAEKQALHEQGVLSVVAVPMIESERLIGFVGFDSVSSERFWDADEIYLLRMSANVISSAITRLRTEKELRRMREKLMHATQLESLGRFVGGTAHDFNNLLTVILGNCDLSESASDDSEMRGYVTEIRSAADQAAILTRSLLAFGRRQEITPKPTDINGLIVRTRSFLERILGNSLSLQVELLPDPANVLIDAGQMQSVLLNLAANARDAMPHGGELTIRLTDDPAAGHIRITVSDTGHGMDSATLERAFDPFFTTKPVHSGTGLGLSSVHGLVSQNGGKVSIDSSPGTGTTVRIDFPRVSSDSAGRADSQTSLLFGSAIDGTVLVVDDDAAVRNVVGNILERAGLTVLTADSGEAALGLLSDERDGIDLVITDIVMPGMGGTELIRRVRRSQPDLPMIAMSGYSEDAIALAVQDKARLHLFTKPIDHGALISAVREYLEPGRGD